MMEKNIEIRVGSLDISNPQLMKIGGLAIATESRSELLGDCFYEIVSKSALDGLIEANDIQLFVNHMPERGTIARSKYGKGSLALTVTDRGLEFETTAPDTPLGRELYEGLSRGDYDACSFGFVVGEDHWDKNDDGTYTRTILSFDRVVEISCLSEAPAYSATECATRSLEKFKEEEKRAEQEEIEKKKAEADAKAEEEKKAKEQKEAEEKAKAEEEAKKAQELKEYYDNLKKGLD